MLKEILTRVLTAYPDRNEFLTDLADFLDNNASSFLVRGTPEDVYDAAVALRTAAGVQEEEIDA